jgi:hypothetical protein
VRKVKERRKDGRKQGRTCIVHGCRDLIVRGRKEGRKEEYKEGQKDIRI